MARGLPIPLLALAVAAWVRYVGGIDEAGREIDVRDPLARQLRETLAQAGGDPAQQVDAILRMQAVFDTDLPQSDAFRSAVLAASVRLAKGARQAVAAA